MTKLRLNFKLIIALTFLISQSFISCDETGALIDFGGLVDEETTEEIVEEEEEENVVSLPVTIDLTDIGLDFDDTSFSVDGFNFISQGAESFDNGGFDNDGQEPIGLTLATGTVILDLRDISDISTISAEVTDNNSAIIIQTFSNDSLVEEVSFSDLSSSTIETISIDVEGIAIDAVSIKGFESELFSITLE